MSALVVFGAFLVAVSIAISLATLPLLFVLLIFLLWRNVFEIYRVRHKKIAPSRAQT